MELSRYVRLVLKKFWIVVILEVVALAATSGYTLSQPLLYTARSTIILNPGVPNPLLPYIDGNNTYGSNLAENYNVIMKSDTFLGKVAGQLDFSISMEDLRRAFSTNLAPSTLVYYLSATYTSPEKAQQIAATVTKLFLSEGLNQSQPDPEDVLANTARQQREEIKTLQTEIDELNRQIRQLQKGDLSDPATQEKIKLLRDDLKDRLDVQSRLVLAVNQSESKASSATARNSATLVDPARLPAKSEPTNLLRNLLFAALIALGLSVGVVILLDYLDYTVHSGEELAQLTGFSTLGTIPLIKPNHPHPADSPAFTAASAHAEAANSLPEKLNSLLVTATAYPSPASEAYRALRTGVLFSTLTDNQVEAELARKLGETEAERPVKSLLITSALPSEGKSLTAANLAIAFAQAGNKVILVDADLRQPALHTLFGKTNHAGFSDLILAGADQLDKIIQPTALPDLWLLTAGTLPPNPSELLTRRKAAAVISALEEAAGLVIFDSPPVGVVTDAAILANRTNRALLVVRWGRTRRDAITRTVNSLNKVGANLSGTVLNRVQAGRGESYAYYNRYGYGIKPKRFTVSVSAKTVSKD